MTPLGLPEAPKMDAKITLGAPQDAEKWSKNFSGGPPARTSEFFFAPGSLQERSGIDFDSVLAAPWGPGGAQGVPGSIRGLISGHLGNLCCLRVGTVFGTYGEPFWPPSWASGG